MRGELSAAELEAALRQLFAGGSVALSGWEAIPRTNDGGWRGVGRGRAVRLGGSVGLVCALAVVGLTMTRPRVPQVPEVQPALPQPVRPVRPVQPVLAPRVPPVPPVPPVAPGPSLVAGYRYTKSESAHLATIGGSGGPAYSLLVPKTREIWIGPDGGGRIRETAGIPLFLGERDRAAWRAAGATPLERLALPVNVDLAPARESASRYEELLRLPSDPGQLAALLRARASGPPGRPVEEKMFTLVGDLLRETVAPAALRAALFHVATGIPGVEVLPQASDRSGRRGVGVALTSDDSGARQRNLYVFDRETFSLLGEERTLLERVEWVDAAPPAVIGYTVYLTSTIVPTLP